jgi:hypothetical protein
MSWVYFGSRPVKTELIDDGVVFCFRTESGSRVNIPAGQEGGDRKACHLSSLYCLKLVTY